MSRVEFLDSLRIGLVEAGVSPVQDIIDFYDESINDRIDTGMSEEQAVLALGDIQDIVKAHVVDMPMPKVVKYKIKESHDNAKKNGNGVIWIVLAIIGFPVWFPVILAIASVLFALYVVLWAIIISFFGVELGFGVAAVGCMLGAFGLFAGLIPGVSALVCVGLACVFAGLCILLWHPIVGLAKLSIKMIEALFKGIKKLFV